MRLPVAKANNLDFHFTFHVRQEGFFGISEHTADWKWEQNDRKPCRVGDQVVVEFVGGVPTKCERVRK